MSENQKDLPKISEPHPNLSKEVNDNIAESELQGGVMLKDLKDSAVLEVKTRNTTYFIEKHSDGFYISGHPKYCPDPVKVNISGSTWGGSMIKVGFIGRGMHLEFIHPEFGKVITSEIQEISDLL